VAITAFRTVDPLTGQERPELVSAIIAQDVEVLAMGQTLVRRIPGSTVGATGEPTGDVNGTEGGQVESDGASREGALSVSLALTPEQAAKLAIIDAMDDNEGQWRIIARRKGEAAPIEGAALWTLEDIFVFTR
jgi:hypothetical protein